MAGPVLAAEQSASIVIGPPPGQAHEAECRALLRSVGSRELFATPCNAGTTVPAGDYEVWIESDRKMSPVLTFVRAAAGDVPVRVECPLADAGRVALTFPADTALLRIYHLREPDDAGGGFQRPFWRESLPADLHAGITFPSGPAFAVALDRGGLPLAVSRRFVVPASAEARIRLAPPAAADLMAIVEKPRTSVSGNDELHLTFKGAVPTSPDLLFQTAEEWFGLWFERSERTTIIRGISAKCFVPATSVRLASGRVALVKQKLRPLPGLEVAVLPDAAVPLTQPVTFVVTPAESRGSPRQMSGVISATARFDDLPPDVYQVKAQIDAFETARTVDLTAGIDGRVLFSLHPIRLTGRVTYGGEGAHAVVRLLLHKPMDVETDSDGAFETLLWQPGRFGLRVTLTGHPDLAPFEDLIKVTADEHLEIDIPKNAFRVRVRDVKTGRPIEAARVDLRNRFGTGETARATTGAVVTDAGGEASLPPIRPGELSLHVRADGYADSEAIVRTVANDDLGETIEVSLHETGDQDAVVITLPDRSPAAGAQVTLVDARGALVSVAEADSNGAVRLPPIAEGWIIVRHDRAGTEIRECGAGRTPPHIALRERAPALRITFTDSAGDPVPSAEVLLIVDGIRLTGDLLATYVRFASATSTRGMWLFPAPPVANLKIVASRGAAISALAGGAYDHLAQDIRYPWPAEVTLLASE